MGRSYTHSLNAMMCKHLLTGASVFDIADITGYHLVTVRHMIKAMRDKGILKIVHYDRSPQGRLVRPVYQFKQDPNEPDIPRPFGYSD